MADVEITNPEPKKKSWRDFALEIVDVKEEKRGDALDFELEKIGKSFTDIQIAEMMADSDVVELFNEAGFTGTSIPKNRGDFASAISGWPMSLKEGLLDAISDE